MTNPDNQSGGVICHCGAIHSGARYTQRGLIYDSVLPADLRTHFDLMAQKSEGDAKVKRQSAQEREREGQLEFFQDLRSEIMAGRLDNALASVESAIKMYERQK